MKSTIVLLAGLALTVPLLAIAGDDRTRPVDGDKPTASPAAVIDGNSSSPTLGSRLNNLKVLSDKVDDVTTLENVLRSFVRPGMTDQERARALWAAAVRYRHQ